MQTKIILKQNARSLRSQMTNHERILWSRIRGKQIHNIQFYRQKVLGPFIVDFYAPAIKLVLEVDGSQHFETEHAKQDQFRDSYLKTAGISVLRFSNLEIASYLDKVLEKIYWKVEDLYKSPRAARDPL